MRRQARPPAPVAAAARLLGVALVLALTPVAARADFAGKDWRCVKEVTVPAGSGYQILRLDPEVLAGSRPDLADLRLMTPTLRERPYVLRIERGGQAVQTVPARLYNLSRVPHVGTRFELDLGARGKPTTQVTLRTPASNFRYQVTVEGGNDAKAWALLRKDGAIFDFTGDAHAHSTVIKMPETRFRYLRVTVHDAGAARPLTIEGATVARAVSRPSERVELKPARVSVKPDPASRRTQVLFDLGHRNQPVSAVRLAFADENVRRRCVVEVYNGHPPEYAPSAEGVVFRYNAAAFVGEQTAVTFPEMRGRYVRVWVYNGDNPPLALTGGWVFGLPRHIVFEGEPARPLRLYYGSMAARPPQYDLASYLQLQPVALREGASLGPERANPDYRAPRKPWSEERPWLLWAALIVAAVVVGSMIVRMMGKISEATPERPERR